MYRLKGQTCKNKTKIPSKVFLQGSILNKARSRLFLTEWQNMKITHHIKYCNYTSFENRLPLLVCPTGAGEPKLKYSAIPFNANGR